MLRRDLGSQGAEQGGLAIEWGSLQLKKQHLCVRQHASAGPLKFAVQCRFAYATMRFKDRLVAAFSGSGKKRSNERPARTAGLEEGCENDSPLVPKRLLSPLAGSERQAARGRQLADLTSTGTVRA